MVTETERRHAGFLENINKLMLWVIMGLLGWLCVSTLALREQMAVVLANQINANREQARNESDHIALKAEIRDILDWINSVERRAK
jgi:hypothetical protein